MHPARRAMDFGTFPGRLSEALGVQAIYGVNRRPMSAISRRPSWSFLRRPVRQLLPSAYPFPPPPVPPPTLVRVTACPCRAHFDLACTNPLPSAHTSAHRTALPTSLLVCPPIPPLQLSPLPLPPAAMAKTNQTVRRSTGPKAPAGLARGAARQATKAGNKAAVKRRY